MARYKIKIAFDGTSFAGWQSQGGTSSYSSVQEVLTSALVSIFPTPPHLTGSSRTDAGVHALGMSAHFDTNEPIKNLSRFLLRINAHLPKTIRILSIDSVSDTFHARYAAISKIYRYELSLGPVQNPFREGYSWHVPHTLNIEAMKKASISLIGTHDFSSFVNYARGNLREKNAIRTLKRIDFIEGKHTLSIEFEADGFLYKMVRNLVGALVEVGRERIYPKDIEELLKMQDRSRGDLPSLVTAPAAGLFLIDVVYRQQ